MDQRTITASPPRWLMRFALLFRLALLLCVTGAAVSTFIS